MEMKQQILSLWADGKTAPEIREELGASKGMVSGVLRRAIVAGEIEKRETTPFWNDELEAQLHRLWQTPLPQDEIAKQMGVSSRFVRKHAKRLRLAPRSPVRPPSAPIAASVALNDSEGVWSPLAGVAPVALQDLEAYHCRWPVEGGFCGVLAVGKYCLHHTEISRRKY